jgi:ubiquinone biosynthesis protein
MSGRRDALPAALCDELSVLHDAVGPMSQADLKRALTAAYGSGASVPLQADTLVSVASGSIAAVFRGRWVDGRDVAIKVQRPDVESRMLEDLALLETLVRWAERLPKCRDMPIGDLAAYVSTAILGQLDFAREAANLTRLGAELSGIAGIRVPAPVDEACRRNCLVMEFIPSLHARNAETCASEERRRMARVALAAVRRMIFVNGFVHCDLHPGNLYVTPDGEVVILDAGFSVQLPEHVRQLIGEFFVALAQGNGVRCARIIIQSAARTRPGTHLDAFTGALAQLVSQNTGPETPRFEMMTFGNALFDLQREYGLHSESAFVFPLMSLAVVESTLRSLAPDIDFMELGQFGSADLTDVRQDGGTASKRPYYQHASVG